MSLLLTPVPVYFDRNGDALEDGYIYVGVEDLDARENPIAVYWDEDLTIPAAQPIRTSGGFPTYQGTASGLFIAESGCSVTVLDKFQRPVLVNVDGVLNGLSGSGGSALVGFIQGGAGAVLRTVQDKLREAPASPLDYGAIYDGTTDAAPSFNEVFAWSPHGQMAIGATNLSGLSVPFALFETTAFVPYTGDMSGNGWNSKIKADSTPTSLENWRGAVDGDKRKRMIRLNLNSSSLWPQQFPGPLSMRFDNFIIDVRAANSSGYEIACVEFAGSANFERLWFVGATCGVRQNTQYSDQVTASRLLMGGQYRRAATDAYTGYLVELANSGDGILVSQCHAGTAIDEGGNLLRGRNTYLRFKAGAMVDGAIGGDILIRDSKIAHSLRAGHLENGRVHFLNSGGSLNDHIGYMRSTADGDLHVSPLRIESDAGASSLSGNVVMLSNYGVHYGSPFAFSTTKPDIELQGNGGPIRMLVGFRGVHRMDANDTNYSQKVIFAANTGDPVFDAYAHLAAVDSWYRNGSYIFGGSMPAINTGDAGIDTGSSGLSSWRPWAAATGTYYYRASLLYDVRRQVGLAGANELTVSPTNGGNGVRVRVTTEFCKPGMIRLYRGTSTGSYNAYVDLPLLAAALLNDDGVTVGGFPWISRTAGPMDTVNASSNGGMSLNAGTDSGAGSDAYGRAIVMLVANALPTAGGWRRGDRLDLRTPVVDGVRWIIGYTRMTDCTSAASTNVLGTDWARLYAE